MIWFVISIILLLFSAAVTGVALSRDVKGAGIGLIPGLVGLLLLIPACLYSVDVGEVDANAVLNESLTDNVLKQHYIDALSNADQLVVVPDGADTLVQTK